MNRLALTLLFAASTLFATNDAKGDITFSIGSAIVTPGATNFDINILVSGNELVTGFNLPVDVGGNGAGIPSGLTLNPGFSNPLFPGFGSSRGLPVGNADLVANSLDLTLTGVSLTATPITAYTLSFSVDPGVAPGTQFPITLLNAQPYDVNGAGGATAVSRTTLTSGTITVEAIPEPTVAFASLFALSGLLLRRRRA